MLFKVHYEPLRIFHGGESVIIVEGPRKSLARIVKAAVEALVEWALRLAGEKSGITVVDEGP